jgi:hypothetical protein
MKKKHNRVLFKRTTKFSSKYRSNWSTLRFLEMSLKPKLGCMPMHNESMRGQNENGFPSPFR